MRFEISKDFRKNISENRKIVITKDKTLFTTVKNCIYKNKTINRKQLDDICNALNIEKPRLRVYNFNQEKNLGKYSYSQKINFKGISAEFAEFIGIMLGDGGIYENLLTITIDKRDLELRAYIKRLFRELFLIDLHEMECKTTNAVRLHKNSRELINLLTN